MPQFCSGSIPIGAHLAFDSVLFNIPDHQKLQAQDGWDNFYWLEGNEVVAFIPFRVHKVEAINPYRSPFGGFEFSSAISEAEKSTFAHLVAEALRARGATQIQVVQPPSREALAFLSTAGFHCIKEVAMLQLDVEQNYVRNLYPAKRRTLKELKAQGFACVTLPPSSLEKVFTFLEQCRKPKGYSISLSLMELTEIQKLDSNTSTIKLFAVYFNGTLAAASIAIRVNASTLYDFAHDHAAAFDALSPVVMLLEGMVSQAKAEGYRWLNLGTSLDGDGNVNQGLLDFKKEIGGTHFNKTIWRCEL